MKSISITTLVLFVLGLYSCSPKTTEVVKDTPVETPKTEPTKQAPKNPCTTFADLSGGMKDEVETAYVLYRDYLKTGDFVQAKKYWEIAYYGAPASNGRVKYQFDDGVKIYSHLFPQANTEGDKKMYVDSVMSIYDKRMECFGDEAYTQGRKGFDLYYTFPGYASDEEILDLSMNYKTISKKCFKNNANKMKRV